MSSFTSGKSKLKKTRHNTNCSVYGCHSRKGADRNIHFHYFPKNNSGIKVKIVNLSGQEEELDKKKAWERVLLMDKPITENMRVCSKHFTNEDYCSKEKLKQPKLRRFAVPSQNLPKGKGFFEESDGISQNCVELGAKRRKIKNVPQIVTDVLLCDYGETPDIKIEPSPSEKLMEVEQVEVVQNLLALSRGPQQTSVKKEVQNIPAILANGGEKTECLSCKVEAITKRAKCANCSALYHNNCAIKAKLTCCPNPSYKTEKTQEGEATNNLEILLAYKLLNQELKTEILVQKAQSNNQKLHISNLEKTNKNLERALKELEDTNKELMQNGEYTQNFTCNCDCKTVLVQINSKIDQMAKEIRQLCKQKEEAQTPEVGESTTPQNKTKIGELSNKAENMNKQSQDNTDQLEKGQPNKVFQISPFLNQNQEKIAPKIPQMINGTLKWGYLRNFYTNHKRK